MPDAVTPAPSDGTNSAIRRDQQALMDRVAAMRIVKAGTPPAPDAGLSERDLSRQLMYDMLSTLTRAEIVLQNTADIVEENTYEIRRANDLKAAELRARNVELEQTTASRNRWFGVWDRGFGLAGVMLGDSRVRWAIVTAVVTGGPNAAYWIYRIFLGGHL